MAEPKTDKAAELARVRSNQRRSRARRKEYVQELEERVRRYERQGVQATAEVQAAAKKIAVENSYLRQLLQKHGIWDHVLDKSASAGASLIPAADAHGTRSDTAVDENRPGSLSHQACVPETGSVQNFHDAVYTPTGSISDDTGSSQYIDSGSDSLGAGRSWSLTPGTAAIQHADFDLRLPYVPDFDLPDVPTKRKDLPVGSSAILDGAYSAPTSNNAVFAGLMATSSQNGADASVWHAIATSIAQSGSSMHASHFNTPASLPGTHTSAEGILAHATLLDAGNHYMPDYNHLFGPIQHHFHGHDHDPPPVQVTAHQ